jgi:S1-C subfamily serine protease
MSRHIVAAFGLLGLLTLSAAAQREDEKAPAKRAEGGAARVSLGVAVEEMPNGGPHGGLIVRHVTPDGPAAKAGVKTGDVIVRVSNRQVDDYDELVNLLAGHRPGEQLTLTVLRDREPQKLKVTLGEPEKRGEKSAKGPDGACTCAYLGVLTMPIQSLPPEVAERLGLDGEEGVVVVNVVPDSPASRAGLRQGDVIRNIDGKEVDDPESLRKQIHEAGAGKEVRLKVQRGEAERELRATLGEGPCDVQLMPPSERSRRSGSPLFLQRLERRLDALERRLDRLEGKDTNRSEGKRGQQNK